MDMVHLYLLIIPTWILITLVKQACHFFLENTPYLFVSVGEEGPWIPKQGYIIISSPI